LVKESSSSFSHIFVGLAKRRTVAKPAWSI